jgi:hypothetical protein
MNVFPFLILLERRRRAAEGLPPPVADSPGDRRARWIAATFCAAVVAAIVAQGLGFFR